MQILNNNIEKLIFDASKYLTLNSLINHSVCEINNSNWTIALIKLKKRKQRISPRSENWTDCCFIWRRARSLAQNVENCCFAASAPMLSLNLQVGSRVQPWRPRPPRRRASRCGQLCACAILDRVRNSTHFVGNKSAAIWQSHVIYSLFTNTRTFSLFPCIYFTGRMQQLDLHNTCIV